MPLVNISVHDENDQSYISFAVEDTGIGIAEDKQGAIFDSFSQADGSTNRKYGGTGLGLTITKQLANLLGGDLVLSSEYGKGSVFTLAIPIAVNLSEQHDSSEQSETTDREIDADENTVFAGRILVAEDDRTNQMLMKLLLEKNSLDVEIAEDGNQAVEKALAESFDLIFMDIQMPHINGYGVTRLLREQGVTTPIIALTANAIKGDDIKCLEAGCDESLSKPIGQGQLEKVFEKFLPKLCFQKS